jgi:hypothetical protein
LKQGRRLYFSDYDSQKMATSALCETHFTLLQFVALIRAGHRVIIW